MNSNEATDSFLGYLYQLRFALLQGLRLRSPSDGVAIEFLDDVAVLDSTSGTLHLHQLKHSIRNRASLGSKSKNLWKTIGNWSDKIQNKTVDIDSTNLYFNTTGKLSSQSPLFHLRLQDRDQKLALALLVDAAKTSSNDVVTKNAAKFLGLSKKLQQALLDQIIVLDSQVNVQEAASDIASVLAVSSRPEHLDAIRTALEGWFFDRAIRSIIDSSLRVILFQEIRSQCITIRDRFAENALPIIEGLQVPLDELSEDDTRAFVKQLQLIQSQRARIRRAQSEHFQALCQRSRWSREGHVAVEELPRFDNKLVQEWEIRHEEVVANCNGGGTTIEVKEGERLYQWIEQHAPHCNPLFIRSTFSEPFLIRGSYQMLADRLEVGWHPRYRELLTNDKK